MSMAEGSSKSEKFLTNIAERIAFANYLPLLTRATVDNQDALPGYMLVEIEKLSYDYPHHCKQLASYLSRRLENSSPYVKTKVLKIMNHLIRNGHSNVRIAWRKNDSALKMATMYHGIPDALTGTSVYEHIRITSKELLELLFQPEKIQEDEKGMADSKPRKQFLGALGSSTPSEGKYQGFGHSPINKEETVTSKVLNYFEKLTMVNDKNSKIIKECIASSIGNYVPVPVPSVEQYKVVAKPLPSLPSIRNTAVKAHVPGRAGGGWEDADDDKKETSHPNLLSEESLEIIDDTPENASERDIVNRFCDQEKTSATWNELNEICTECNKLSCSEVLKAIADKLKMSNSIRALILLDVLFTFELMATSRAVTEAQQILGDVLTKISNDPSVPDENRIKAEKIRLIIISRLAMVE